MGVFIGTVDKSIEVLWSKINIALILHCLPSEVDNEAHKDIEALKVRNTPNPPPELFDAPYSRIRMVYDTDADVLYLNFKKPSHADDSELMDDDLIIRYENGDVVGITVLNASRKEWWGEARQQTPHRGDLD